MFSSSPNTISIFIVCSPSRWAAVSYHQEDAKHACPGLGLTHGGSRLCKRHLLHRLGCLLTPSTASTNESSSKQSSEKHPIACDVDIITSQTVSIPNGNRVPNVYYKHAPRARCSGDVALMLIHWRSAKSATSKYSCRRFSIVTLTIQNVATSHLEEHCTAHNLTQLKSKNYG